MATPTQPIGAPPELRRKPRLGIRPRHALLRVPRVIQKAGLGVASVLLHQDRLLGDEVEVFGTVERLPELGADRAAHVQPVQPHLVAAAVVALVPEAAHAVARVGKEDFADRTQRRFVARVVRARPQRIQQDARLKIVHLAAVKLKDAAVFVDHRVHPVPHVAEIALVPGQQIRLIHAGKKHALMVVKPSHRRQKGRFVAAHHGFHGKARGLHRLKMHASSSFKMRLLKYTIFRRFARAENGQFFVPPLEKFQRPCIMKRKPTGKAANPMARAGRETPSKAGRISEFPRGRGDRSRRARACG